MFSRKQVLPLFVGFLTGLATLSWISAAPKSAVGTRMLLKMERDFIADLDDSESPFKPGKKIDLLLKSGKRNENLEIVSLKQGKDPGSILNLDCLTEKGVKQKLAMNTITQISAEERIFDVVQDSKSKAFLLLDETKRDRLVIERLRKSGHDLWKDPTAEERKETIESAKEWFTKTKELFPGHPFLFKETEFFMFFTDMPESQVAGYIANLDAMYRQLCQLFSIPPSRNIWKGKCPVITFVERGMFGRFEREVMKNPTTDGVQGLHHGVSDGRVLITMVRGDDPAFFAAVLVHETTHGFLHRFRSNVHIHSWLNEGLAEYVAAGVVPACKVPARREERAIVTLRSEGAVGRDFFRDDSNIDAEQYGLAFSMTRFLIASDENNYRAFLIAIKEGYPEDEALEMTYGGKRADLVQSFARSVGIPGLRP